MLLGQLNLVGYVNITCPVGYSLLSFPLINSPNNDPASVMDNQNGEFDECQIEIWTNGQFIGYIGDHNASGSVNGWLEPNGPIFLNPGVGASFYNGTGSNCSATLVGIIPVGTYTQTLGLGLNLVGSVIPTSGGFNGPIFSFPSPSTGQMDGDQVYLLFNTSSGFGYTTFTADSLSRLLNICRFFYF
jgi:hypothetical protein